MKADTKELEEFIQNLEKLKDDAPEIIEKLLMDEAVLCVKRARQIVNEENKVYTGAYKNSFHCGDKNSGQWVKETYKDGKKPRKNGNTYTTDVYNNLEYASFLEMGFRSHFVPAKYLDEGLMEKVYEKMVDKAVEDGRKIPKPPGGVYVGEKDSYVQGIYALKKAEKHVLDTQEERIKRKWNEEMGKRLGKDWRKIWKQIK